MRERISMCRTIRANTPFDCAYNSNIANFLGDLHMQFEVDLAVFGNRPVSDMIPVLM